MKLVWIVPVVKNEKMILTGRTYPVRTDLVFFVEDQGKIAIMCYPAVVHAPLKLVAVFRVLSHDAGLVTPVTWKAVGRKRDIHFYRRFPIDAFPQPCGPLSLAFITTALDGLIYVSDDITIIVTLEIMLLTT